MASYEVDMERSASKMCLSGLRLFSVGDGVLENNSNIVIMMWYCNCHSTVSKILTLSIANGGNWSTAESACIKPFQGITSFEVHLFNTR